MSTLGARAPWSGARGSDRTSWETIVETLRFLAPRASSSDEEDESDELKLEWKSKLDSEEVVLSSLEKLASQPASSRSRWGASIFCGKTVKHSQVETIDLI